MDSKDSKFSKVFQVCVCGGFPPTHARAVILSIWGVVNGVILFSKYATRVRGWESGSLFVLELTVDCFEPVTCCELARALESDFLNRGFLTLFSLFSGRPG